MNGSRSLETLKDVYRYLIWIFNSQFGFFQIFLKRDELILWIWASNSDKHPVQWYVTSLAYCIIPPKNVPSLDRQLLLTDSPHISLLVVCEEVWFYEGILTSWFVNKFVEEPYHFKPFFMPVNSGCVRYCFVNCSVSLCSVAGPYFYPLSQKKMFVFIPTSWLSISWSVHLPP